VGNALLGASLLGSQSSSCNALTALEVALMLHPVSRVRGPCEYRAIRTGLV
jgi:hypothetical protein